MTNEQAIKILKHNREVFGKSEHGKYHRNANTIACDIAIQALEKQIAKEPEWIEGRNIFKEGEECPYCVDCSEELNEDYPYCPECGQKIGWSDEQ